MRLITLILLLLPAALAANDWDALEHPGAVAIMRHALAHGTGDPANFELGNCDTQRTLDKRGRNQARAIGAAFRARGISFDQVLTSQWCRTRETAELLNLGPVVEAPALNSFFGRYERRAGQTRDTRALLRDQDGRVMLVTHQVNISALAGQTTRSGEVLVIRFKDGEIEVLGSILLVP
jgi:phosphohistidine phosphatase SixA